MSAESCEVWFYHLERTALDQALPELLEKTLAKGWKALVRTTTGSENLNGAQALFLVDGAEAGPLDGYERCVLLFDGRDEAATAEARGRWKAFKAAGHPVSYWRQGIERGWEREA